jgi:integrase
MALSDLFVRQVKSTGKTTGDKYTDGSGMYLLVKPAGKYWRFDYTFAGKRKTLALGVYPDISLSVARGRLGDARTLVATGVDPSIAKREQAQADKDAAANTFEAVARDWLDKTKSKRGAVTRDKVLQWLVKDVFPFIGSAPIASIKSKDLLDKVLRRMEARGINETAHRIAQICSQVWRFAVASGLAERDIVADLRGALASIEKTSHPAITQPKPAGQLLRSIRAYEGHPTVRAALEISPLVFVRPGELRAAEWSEIDLEEAEWRIPASRMKMKIEHLVPLATQAVDVLRTLHQITGHGRYVFPSIRTGERCMSENTVNAALRGMGYTKEVMTAHGFRAMARTIMDEVLEERVDLIEHQLAHLVKDPNGRAYNRTAHLPARRKMMQRWADYLDVLRIGGNVVPLTRAA